VEKDRSLSGFVEAGFEQFSPLLDFRDWLVAIRNDPERRLARRRGGRITFTSSGVQVPGPFTLQTRAEMLDRLLKLQQLTELTLISDAEVSKIRALWTDDAIATVKRTAHENELAAEEK
jgi:DNA sulfur modification protein DndC